MAYIAMPWDERVERWTAPECVELLRLAREGLSRSEIADALAEAGYPARDDTCISEKLRSLGRQQP